MTKKRAKRQSKALREKVKREQRRQALVVGQRRSGWAQSLFDPEADQLVALISKDYLRDDPDEGEAELWSDGWGDDEEPPFTEAQELTAERLEAAVRAVMHEKTLAPAAAFRIGGDAFGPVGEPAQSPDSAAWQVLSQWLIAARQAGLDSAAVMAWIGENLPADDGPALWQASGLIGFVSAPPLLIGEMIRELDDRFIPALIGLAAGIAAVPGAGDPRYLREFDPGLSWPSYGPTR